MLAEGAVGEAHGREDGAGDDGRGLGPRDVGAGVERALRVVAAQDARLVQHDNRLPSLSPK